MKLDFGKFYENNSDLIKDKKEKFTIKKKRYPPKLQVRRK